MRVLITGGCGFSAHHVVEHIIKNTDWQIVVWDKLTYAASGFDRLRNIKCFDVQRVKVLTTDIALPIPEGIIQETGKIDYILHMAAETHVDNSIGEPEPFIMTNVVGTMHLLNYARTLQNLKLFVYFSTDEVFGPAPRGKLYKEWDRYNSSNPYSASKAAGEELTLAYANTYKVPTIVTHTMNIFGERQHYEKFIPLIIRKVLSNEKVIIHADKRKQAPGSRFYIHARNVAHALLFLIDHNKLKLRDKYNIVGQCEIDNLELAKYIAQVLGRQLKYELTDYHVSRPGHDLRYSLDGTKMTKMGWQPPINFTESLDRTINWYFQNNNRRWLGL